MANFKRVLWVRMLSLAGGTLLLIGIAIMLNRKSVITVPPPPQEPREGTLTLLVLDEHARPVSNAAVRPIGLRSKEEPGTAYGWVRDKSKRKDITSYTDASGSTTIAYPLLTPDNLHTGKISLVIQHPDFCSNQQDVSVDSPQPIQLIKGTKLTLKAMTLHGESLPGVYADITDDNFKSEFLKWIRASDERSLSAYFPPGLYVVRAVVMDPDGAPLFSDPVTFLSARSGERTLQLPVHSGMTIHGHLDSTVPRPVKNGMISGCVITPLPATYHSDNAVHR